MVRIFRALPQPPHWAELLYEIISYEIASKWLPLGQLLIPGPNIVIRMPYMWVQYVGMEGHEDFLEVVNIIREHFAWPDKYKLYLTILLSYVGETYILHLQAFLCLRLLFSKSFLQSSCNQIVLCFLGDLSTESSSSWEIPQFPQFQANWEDWSS